MSDLIYRQQAIDVLEEQLDFLFMLNKKDNPTAESKWYGVNWARNTIAELPSAEPKMGEKPITNKEWLAKLTDEECYRAFKKAEEDGRAWTSTPLYVIKWLGEERRHDDKNT